jgi:lipopolysaccharide export system permease protein
MMISRLDRYVARTYLSSWLVSIVFFLGLFSVISFFGNMEDLIKHAGRQQGSATWLVARFYAYQMPTILVQVAPFVMLMAGLFTVMRLQRHNELMAMLMVGRSARRIAAPILVLTVVFIAAQVWVQEFLAPRFALAAKRLDAQVSEGRADWVIEGITLKDASGFLLSIRNFRVNDGVVEEFHASGRDARGNNVSISGHDAVFDAGTRGWRLFDGQAETRPLGVEAEPIRAPAPFFQTDIRPEDLLDTRLKPFDLSWSDVLERSERYPHSDNYRMLRHYHVTYPLSVLLLVLLGLPFVLRRQARNNLFGVGISILLCMLFMIVDATVRDLGARGFLAPVLAAWLPVIVAGSFAVVLFDGIDT